MTAQDHIYRDPKQRLVDFAFDHAVAEVFPDMIRRSVPAYETVVPLTALLAARHLAGARPENLAGPAPPLDPVPFPERTEPPGRAPSQERVASQRHATSLQQTTSLEWAASSPDTGENSSAAGVELDSVGPVFDLGCSLGATTLALLHLLEDKPCRIVAVDNSQPMLDRAVRLVEDERVEFRLQDIRETDVSGADVIFMNYVLQFLPPAERLRLLTRLRKQMVPGGLLLLSEKIDFAGAGDQAFFDATHLAFKRANGYSELEVSGKRNALENVMIVDTEETHVERLHSAGFATVRTWFRCLNWASFLAWA